MASRIFNPMANQPIFTTFANIPLGSLVLFLLSSPQGGTEWSGVCGNLSRILIKEVACPHRRAAGVMIEGGRGGAGPRNNRLTLHARGGDKQPQQCD